ncbi:MAG: hypothetical protein OJF52_001174 [Nitrospira sp.]|nr:MAG: hypothetical protein OJF52_001174 [Nitrospira sp.]
MKKPIVPATSPSSLHPSPMPAAPPNPDIQTVPVPDLAPIPDAGPQSPPDHTAPPMTVGRWIDQMIQEENALLTQDEAKLSIIEHWEKYRRNFPLWLLDTELTVITEDDCRRHLGELRARVAARTLAESTLHVQFVFLQTLLQRAVEAGHRTTNPAAAVLRQLPPSRGRGTGIRPMAPEKALSPEALIKVLTLASCVLSPCYFVLFAVIGLAGLLMSEARVLQVGDVELDHTYLGKPRPRLRVRRLEHNGSLSIPGWQERYVDVNPVLAAILRWWIATLPSREPTTWLFPGPLPKAGSNRASRIQPGTTEWCLSKETVREQWNVLMQVYQPTGRRPSLRALQFAYFTASLTLGEDILYVSRQAGHATERYTRQVFKHWHTPQGRDHLASWSRQLSPSLRLPPSPPAPTRSSRRSSPRK